MNYLWLEGSANYCNAALSAQFKLLQKFDVPIFRALQLSVRTIPFPGSTFALLARFHQDL